MKKFFILLVMCVFSMLSVTASKHTKYPDYVTWFEIEGPNLKYDANIDKFVLAFIADCKWNIPSDIWDSAATKYHQLVKTGKQTMFYYNDMSLQFVETGAGSLYTVIFKGAGYTIKVHNIVLNEFFEVDPPVGR